jgi:PAS domain S-box-containing protein
VELALHAALLGAVMGTAVLAVSTIYGATLPAAPAAFPWWAAAFVLEAASQAMMLGLAGPLAVQLVDLLHAMAAVLQLVGALAFFGMSARPAAAPLGILVVIAWTMAAQGLRQHFGLLDLPIFGLGGVPLLLSASAFLRRREVRRADGHQIAAASFAAAGLHHLLGPTLAGHPVLATWSFVSGQFLSVVMAVALLVVVLRRQQALTESEGRRAALLQSRLVDALDSVQDGVALFDSLDCLVTCNDRYRDWLRPCAALIVPGMEFAALMEILARRGLVLDARGNEDDWIAMAVSGHSAAAAPREQQMFDGRWMAVSVYPTADGGHLRLVADITERKQAEKSLTETVAWLRGIMDTVVDGLVTIDQSGSILSFNAAACRIFGYNLDEVVGRPVGLLMPEPDCAVHDGYMARYMVTGNAHIVGIGRQVEGRRKDGSRFPLELAISEMRDGDTVTFIGVLRDITDRKRVQAALMDSEERFRDLAESASDWFWETNARLNFAFVSDRVRDVLGVGPDAFRGKPFGELGQSCPVPGGWDQLRKTMKAYEPFRGFVVQYKRPDGETRYVEMAGRPAQDCDGVFRGYRGTACDITPLKRHERQLAEQAGLRQTIIDNMGQGVVVFDGEGELVALNSAARHLLDLPVGEIDPGIDTDKSFLTHLALHGELGEGDHLRLADERLALIRTRPNDVFEHQRPNGTVLEGRSNGMPDGGLILTFTDITERKRGEDVLREAKEAAERGGRAKATFLANISHELRTPLNAIIGFSELMKHEIFGPMEQPSYRGYVDDIHASGMHLLELINDILDMSKAEAGKTELVETDVDLAEVVAASVRMMIRRAESCGIEIVVDLPADLPAMVGDERRLRQIVLNLLSNAVKFSEDQGRVTVAAAASEQGMSLVVSDTGIGMSEKDLVRVMDPFVQADTRLSRKYEGTGLGLPLTRSLVEAHGGVMTLASTPGAGTTVTALFPPDRIVGPIGFSLAVPLEGAQISCP